MPRYSKPSDFRGDRNAGIHFTWTQLGFTNDIPMLGEQSPPVVVSDFEFVPSQYRGKPPFYRENFLRLFITVGRQQGSVTTQSEPICKLFEKRGLELPIQGKFLAEAGNDGRTYKDFVDVDA